MSLYTIISRISPTKIERLSAWTAVAWVAWLTLGDPLVTYKPLRPLSLVASEPIWATLMVVIAVCQFGGNWARDFWARLIGAWLAFLTWFFISVQFLVISGVRGLGWMVYGILAWGCACLIITLVKGERRA